MLTNLRKRTMVAKINKKILMAKNQKYLFLQRINCFGLIHQKRIIKSSIHRQLLIILRTKSKILKLIPK